MTNTDIVVAFSGGLDTSFCLPYLQEKGYRVHTLFADTGGVSAEERAYIEARAHELGTASHRTVDVGEDLFREFVKPLLMAGELYQGQYPLLVSDRYLIVKHSLLRCDELGTKHFAHGCTGMGNDQVRFDLTVRALGDYVIVAPIREEARAPIRGVIQLLNREEGPFDEEDERYLVALATQLARALSLTTLRPAAGGGPGLVLQGPYNRILGRSALKEVYERVQLAAQTDATVLLRGETGTGKGLFARAIHVNSRRQARPFVTVDCTTLPAQLVESELFGHERGAFTGADRRVPGKVEQAEGGTLFLDELGDLPPDIQGKLLRFLQERTFERVGGRQTLTADVRIVCATHRDLEQAVEIGKFRQDLYYRVRVVEIELPPLRDRGPDEIEALARHFAEQFATRYSRPPPSFTLEALAVIRTHPFPGNVRELEHWIESAVALSPDGRVTRALLPGRRAATGEIPIIKLTDENNVTIPLGLSLEEASRRYIDATVRACDGNKTEAAKRLGIGRNTLGRSLVKK